MKGESKKKKKKKGVKSKRDAFDQEKKEAHPTVLSKKGARCGTPHGSTYGRVEPKKKKGGTGEERQRARLEGILYSRPFSEG